MAGYKIHNFTVQEAQNIQIGQCPTAYLDSGTAFTDIAGGLVVIAVQVIQDTSFAQLVAEDANKGIGTGAGNDNSHNPGETGDKIGTSTVFPAGTVLYGRWTTVEVNDDSGIVVLYLGK